MRLWKPEIRCEGFVLFNSEYADVTWARQPLYAILWSRVEFKMPPLQSEVVYNTTKHHMTTHSQKPKYICMKINVIVLLELYKTFAIQISLIKNLF